MLPALGWEEDICSGRLERSEGGGVGESGFLWGHASAGMFYLPVPPPAANESLVAPSVPQTGSSNTISASLAWCCTCTAVQWSVWSMGCQDVLRSHLLSAGGFVMESVPNLITGRPLREGGREGSLECKEYRVCLGQGAW